MEPREVRLTVRSLLVLVAFCALVFAVGVQTVRLQQASAREEQLRAIAARERARAEANLASMRGAFGPLLSQAKPQDGPSGPQSASARPGSRGSDKGPQRAGP